MRILFMPSSFIPVIGGVQTVVYDLAEYFFSKDHQVKVITNRYPRNLPEAENIEGIDIKRWLFLKPGIKHLRNRRIDIFLASIYFYPRTLASLAKEIREFKPEVVNVHYPDIQTAFVLKILNKAKFRLIVSLHGYDIERWFNTDPRFNLKVNTDKERMAYPDFVLLKEILEKADAVTACSKYLLSKTTELFPKIKEKGYVAYNGINPDQFNNSEIFKQNSDYILAYGRLSYQKGFDILLEAFSRLANKALGLKLLIIGEGEERENLEKKTIELRLEQRVRFIGPVSYKDLAKYIKGSKFVVIPSRWEPFGLVALESFACARTVIATTSGGIQEIVRDGQNGLVVEKENPFSLSKAISKLIEEEQLRAALEINSLKTIAQFTKESMCGFYQELFRP
ncbi:MAG: glycosyltransferase family 4 protein [Candidatus Omnitrophica bacterium]|nr:glycosyltransferase family 4 protein [Candidatus Omnitrophota bacterium]